MPPTKTKPGPATPTSQDEAVQAKLETLKKEYNELHTQKIKTEQNIANLEDKLQELRAKAEKEFGTSDLAELQQILEDRRRENEARVADYEKHLQEIKTNLGAIETPPGEAS